MQRGFSNRFFCFETSNFIDLIAYISIITSSFDIFLDAEVLGFTVRLTQLCSIFLFAVFMMQFMKSGRTVVPVNFGYLFIYVLLNTIFIINSIYIKNSVGYELWLLLNVLQLFIFVNLYNDRVRLIKLLKVYFYSFVLLSVIGIIQHIALVTGIGKIILLNSRYDRIHGFSYEPSFYSTYLLPGWCAMLYYIEKGNYFLFPRKKLIKYFIIITLALAFSFSRMALIAAMLYLLFRYVVPFFNTKANSGRLIIKKRNAKIHIILFVILLMVILYIALLYNYNYARLQKMVFGLGILGTAGHSSTTRIGSLGDTLEIFFKSPILGCSLGDIDGRIAASNGIAYYGQTGLSMSIIAEQFAATGIFGGVCFVIYLIKSSLLYRKIEANECYMEMLKGICFGLIFQVFLLNMNQNVLRSYFWVNLSIISVIYSNRNLFINTELNAN